MKNRFYFALTAGLMLLYSCQPKETYYVKHVVFPEDATPVQKIEMASRVIPSPQQLAWQEMELTAFLHFGMNTFTRQEWGDGKESPTLFNPTELNTEQWVRSLKEAGFKMAIITAKHHDGFCLWPTATTNHSVASSPWREGKGDVVREFREACRKYDLKFGVYLSPWDRNAECYGDSPRYNEFFVRQLTELLTNYGEVHEVWFDGACGEGPNGKKQVYDWNAFSKTIARLQPHAVTAIMGNDVRWVGNEKGLGRETEWSITPLAPGSYDRAVTICRELGIDALSQDLGSRQLVAKAKELFWYPSEVDVSIRPGWFFHTEQNSEVKSLSKLVDIYFRSVGYNSVLLLNIPPDTRGLIHEVDARRIKELSDYLKTTFDRNFIADGGKPWNGEAGASRIYELPTNRKINTFLLQEEISKGQRIESFRLERETNGSWTTLAEGTTIGYKRLLRFPETQAQHLRLTITASRGNFNLKRVGAFFAPAIEENEQQQLLSSLTGLKVIGAPPAAAQMVDGKVETCYRTSGLAPIIIDLGKEVEISGFSYTPPVGNDLSGTLFTYALYTGKDGKQWSKAEVSGEFSNIKHNPITQFVRFPRKLSARFLKLEPLSEINGENRTSIAEIGILTQ